MVRQSRRTGTHGRRRHPGRRHHNTSHIGRTPLLRLGRRHARLDHFPATLVGSPHPHLVWARWGSGVPWPRRRGSRGLHPRPGRARHLVFLRPLAVLHHGLARENPRTGEILPNIRAGHRLRHPVLLGGPHDDVWHLRRPHHPRNPRVRPGRAAPNPIHRPIPPRPGARRTRPEDEQVAGQRHRPHGLGGRIRCRRAPLHPGPRLQPGRGPAARRRRRPKLPELRHQTLQRHPVCPHERRPRCRHPRCRRPHRRRQVDPRPPGTSARRRRRLPGPLPVRQGQRGPVPVHLE